MLGGSYAPPGMGGVKATQCSCSRVAYNLFSACAACQESSGVHWVKYTNWNSLCLATGIDRHLSSITSERHKADLMLYSSSFNYTDPAAAARWMSISGQDSFSVEEAIGATGPLTSTTPSIMPTPLPPLPGSSNEVGGPPEDPATTAADPTDATDSAQNANPNTKLLPVILGPTLGVAALAGLFFLWWCLRRRKTAKRVAPSAEFKRYQRTSIPLADVEGGGGGGTVRGMRSIDDQPASYAAYHASSGEAAEEGDAPPAFTPGLFKDPIFEKGVAMTLANQSATWPARLGSGGTTSEGVGLVPAERQPAERQDSSTFSALTFASGDSHSPASVSLPPHGPLGQQTETQRLIPPDERY
jgi:hypothetical protein